MMMNPSNENKKNTKCHACGEGIFDVFHKIKHVPVNSVLNIPDKRKAKEFPSGSLSLGFCPRCGFISNIDFDQNLCEYDTGYEATQSYSSTFTAFAKKQAEALIERHDLKGKNLLEIGCGNGEFLALLCELGDNRGVGFDPAYVEGRVFANNQITFIKDYYSEKYAAYKADFLYCKMTLEHINDPRNLVAAVRRSIGNHGDTVVFFQVPDVTRILQDYAFEDIYYEHCSYFSPGSLARLFRRCAFEVIDLSTDYNGQYVMIEAKPSNRQPAVLLPEEDDMEKLRNLVSNFPGKLGQKLSGWWNKIGLTKENSYRTVIWGASSKGVSFLTTLGVTDEIQYAVDINPYRQGTYLPGTGHTIVSPDFLKEYKPDVVIVMNAIYKGEIQKDLQKLGLSPEILTL